MAGLAFDTHKAVKALREAGADEPLAEAVVVTIGDALGEHVATKADVAEVKTGLAEVKAELKADVAEVKAELKADVAEVKAELKADMAEVKVNLAEMETRLYRHLWMMAAGIVGLTVSLTVALVKLTS